MGGCGQIINYVHEERTKGAHFRRCQGLIKGLLIHKGRHPARGSVDPSQPGGSEDTLSIKDTEKLPAVHGLILLSTSNKGNFQLSVCYRASFSMLKAGDEKLGTFGPTQCEEWTNKEIIQNES